MLEFTLIFKTQSETELGMPVFGSSPSFQNVGQEFLES